MPKGFSEREKNTIRQRLMQAAREQFSQFGLKKTSVEELTRAAGISKGAFYLFFPSKEDLFFEVLEGYELDYRTQLFATAFQDHLSPRESMKAFLLDALTLWHEHPLFRRISQEDLEILMRRLPEERVQAHLHADERSIEALIAQFEQAGARVQMEPKLVAGLVKALFFVSFHRQEIGEEIFPQTMRFLVDQLVQQMIPETDPSMGGKTQA